MKKLSTILLMIAMISGICHAQNLNRAQTIGQSTRNQKVGKGLQVADTLLANGTIIASQLNGTGYSFVMIDSAGTILRDTGFVAGQQTGGLIFNIPSGTRLIIHGGYIHQYDYTGINFTINTNAILEVRANGILNINDQIINDGTIINHGIIDNNGAGMAGSGSLGGTGQLK